MTRDEILAKLNELVACEVVLDVPHALRIDGFLRAEDMVRFAALLVRLQAVL